MTKTERLKKQLLTKRVVTPISSKELLSSGYTLFNLACTGKTAGAVRKGTYFFCIGDSDAGKTIGGLTFLAEAANNPEFDDYRLVLDDPEETSINIREKFGNKLADRIERPGGTEDDPVVSTTVQEFYDNLDDAQKDGRPFVWVLDSENVLSSDEESKKIDKTRSAKRNQKEASGSMTDAKAKVHSQRLRRVRNRLKKNGSILIILGQTRDNFGFAAQFNPKTRAGGWALKFYTKLEVWLSVKENITRQVKGKKRQLGILTKLAIKKNHYIGKKRSVFMPIYWSSGIDDVGGMIDYLIEEKHWKGSENNFRAPEFKFTGGREELVSLIETKSKERELRKIVGKVWREIEAACVVERKTKYE